MIKSCISCAFCVRHKNKYISASGIVKIDPFWEKSFSSLTKEERILLQNEKSDFIGADKRKHDEWVKNYHEQKAKKETELEKQQGIGLTVAELIGIPKGKQKLQNLIPYRETYSDYQKYGIKEKKPTNYYDEDYLSCWKGNWDENKNPELVEKRKELKERKCKYFFAHSTKGYKTLELCDEERRDGEQRKQFFFNINDIGSDIFNFSHNFDSHLVGEGKKRQYEK